MEQEIEKFEHYFRHLSKISVLGRVYKRLFASPIIYLCARYFGHRIVEVGFGTGSGVIGAFPRRVSGLEINPVAVAYCRAKGMQVRVIDDDGSFPEGNAMFDACVLDNVLEHIDDPRMTLRECHRVTSTAGGMVIIVPGHRGYALDNDHKIFYDAHGLRQLDPRWEMTHMFSMPLGVVSEALSRTLKQYCLVAVYRKRDLRPSP